MSVFNSSRIGILAVVLAVISPHLNAQACEVNASGISFGTYIPDELSDNDSSGTITLRCSNLVSVLVPYSISLSTGLGASYTTRALAGPLSDLDYQLYSDSARTLVWGDGSAGTSTVDGVILLQAIVPNEASIVVYSRLPALQETSPGSYSDTIVVTVTF